MEKRVSLEKNEFGFRDVYWCFLLNEASLGPVCTNCGWEVKDEYFLNEHKFICHIKNGNHWKEEK